MAKDESGSDEKSRWSGLKGTVAMVGTLVGGLLAGISQFDEIKGMLQSLVGEPKTEVVVAEPPAEPDKPERKTCFKIDPSPARGYGCASPSMKKSDAVSRNSNSARWEPT